MNRELMIFIKDTVDDQIHELETLAGKNKLVHKALEPAGEITTAESKKRTVYNKITRLYTISTSLAKCIG